MIEGHKVDPRTGTIHLQRSILHGSPARVLSTGDSVLNIHIPAGPKLVESECQESLLAARAFFAENFPELMPKAFICSSWLLDRELGCVLPPHSGILAFGRLFYPLILKDANDHQIVERVLQNPATPPTTLQKAVLDHQQAGGKFKMTGGFRLMENHPLPPGY